MVAWTTQQMRLRGSVLALSLALSGCAQGPEYGAPSFPFAGAFSQAPGAAPVLLSNAAWWRGLDDATLDHMVALGLDRNLDLALAIERVGQAQSLRRAVPGAALISPTADITARGSDQTAGTDVTGLARVGLTWVLDPYGARRSQMEGAEADIRQAAAEANAAQLLMLYSIATTYADLRYQQRLLALSRAELGNRNATLALTRTLEAADQATRLEITRSEARVAEIRAELPGLEAQVRSTLNELAILGGTQPGGLPEALYAGLAHGAGQPVPSLSPEVGIPADLLRNRPDIAVAEAAYYAAIADVGVAQAELYPRLSLTGAISLNGLDARSDGVEYFFGPVVAFPSLPLGATRASVEARHSAVRQAHITWKSTVLNAILEVENALGEYNATITSLRAARTATRLYGETLSLTRQVFQSGEATLSDLILAEQALAASQRSLAQMERDAALGFIALNVRLGAGNTASAP